MLTPEQIELAIQRTVLPFITKQADAAIAALEANPPKLEIAVSHTHMVKAGLDLLNNIVEQISEKV